MRAFQRMERRGPPFTVELTQSISSNFRKIKMTQHTWTDPAPIREYLNARKSKGIYMIGSPTTHGVTPTPSNESDPYLLDNFPNDFKIEYVGISEGETTGVRARLSKHARCKGNKHVANLLKSGVPLYYIAIYGDERITSFEPLFTALKTSGQFVGNVRLEHERNHSKRHEKIHELMTGQKLEHHVPWDFEGDGM